MDDKLGTYITKLMTTALDKDAEEFIKNLAMAELRRVNANITEFIKKQIENDEKEKNKQLLQEEVKDGK